MSLQEFVDYGELKDLEFTKLEMWEFAELDDVIQYPQASLTILFNFVMLDLEAMEEI